MRTFLIIFNNVFSNCILGLFLVGYTRITMEKSKRAERLLLLFCALYIVAFSVPSLAVYGDAIAFFKQYRNVYSLLEYFAFLLYFLLGFREHSTGERVFLYFASMTLLFLGDLSFTFLTGLFDLIFGTNVSMLMLDLEKYAKWYLIIAFVGVGGIYLFFLLLLRKFYPRVKKWADATNAFSRLPFLLVPAAQIASVMLLNIIGQTYSTFAYSASTLLFSGIILGMGVVSDVGLLVVMNRFYRVKLWEEKVRQFADYGKLSVSLQEQAERVTRETAMLRHDFNNRMQVIYGLIENGEVEEAKRLAAEMEKKLNQEV